MLARGEKGTLQCPQYLHVVEVQQSAAISDSFEIVPTISNEISAFIARYIIYF